MAAALNPKYLKECLKNRKEISYETYEALHRGQLEQSVTSPKNTFVLQKIGKDPLMPGVRRYQYVLAAVMGSAR